MQDSSVRMFELYLLSIVNASMISGYSIYKLITGWKNVYGSKRLMASVLGYFIHDFIALRGTWTDDVPTVIHHVFGIATVGYGILVCMISYTVDFGGGVH
mgnify:CR=1 FL=1